MSDKGYPSSPFVNAEKAAAAQATLADMERLTDADPRDLSQQQINVIRHLLDYEVECIF